MYLVFFFVVFASIGYLLASSRFSGQIDQTAESIADKPRTWIARFRDRGRKTLPVSTPTHPFVLWSAGEGVHFLPDDFRTWLTSLPPQEADAFALALEGYAQGLGFQLGDLTHESLQAKPALMQVYVEALTIYSQAYRKAKQAHKSAEKTEENPSASSSDGLKANGKQDGKVKREAANAPEPALSPAS